MNLFVYFKHRIHFALTQKATGTPKPSVQAASLAVQHAAHYATGSAARF